MNHPAKFSNALLPVMAEQIKKHLADWQYGFDLLDPFAGTGKIFIMEDLLPGCYVRANELEAEWAHKRSRIGDALNMDCWDDGEFDAICTSPTYGNRMADHHEAKDASRRNTYRHQLGRALSPNNSGGMQWGDEYREFHVKAWTEATRVLCSGGIFVLNISNHIRKGQEQFVSEWHRDTLISMGYELLEDVHVETPRQKNGANANLRVAYEHVYTFRKV